jgi:hypothetical protein
MTGPENLNILSFSLPFGTMQAAVYGSMRDAIERNFEAAKRYLDPLGVGVWEGGLAELVEERSGNQGLGMGLTTTGFDVARGDNVGALTDRGETGDRPVSGEDSDVGQGAVVVIVSVDVGCTLRLNSLHFGKKKPFQALAENLFWATNSISELIRKDFVRYYAPMHRV